MQPSPTPPSLPSSTQARLLMSSHRNVPRSRLWCDRTAPQGSDVKVWDSQLEQASPTFVDLSCSIWER
ncbi:hypothetical protein L2E82_08120 [Cichorium intybus]|uniref:Uncharacterized protein n=1 Tax=Cichorium intybus TaxID=13427 RepID=A0ACB9G7J7_CICIN|nr:hypothetical protein L2E82_08120 [Cichorium intybus]